MRKKIGLDGKQIVFAFLSTTLFIIAVQIGLGFTLKGLNNHINSLFGIEYFVEIDRDAYQSYSALSLLLNTKDYFQDNGKHRIYFEEDEDFRNL